MTKISYSEHLQRRIKERKIPKDYPMKIYNQSKIRYFDKDTKHYIAITKLKYAQKLRNMALVYDKIGNEVELVTVFPISESELKNKIKSGRWSIK